MYIIIIIIIIKPIIYDHSPASGSWVVTRSRCLSSREVKLHLIYNDIRVCIYLSE